MTIDEVPRKILWLGIESATGLWEILWELRAPPDHETVTAIRSAVAQLLDDGCIRLYEEDDPRYPLRPLRERETADALELWSNWLPPSGGDIVILFEATDVGQRRFWDQSSSDARDGP